MLATRTASVNAGDRVQAGDGRHAGALGRGVHDIAPCEGPSSDDACGTGCGGTSGCTGVIQHEQDHERLPTGGPKARPGEQETER